MNSVEPNLSTNYDGLNMPYSLEAEQAVLGSILKDPRCMPTVLVHVKSEHFYLPQHRAIFAIMVELDANAQPLDALVVLERLKKDGVYDDAGGKTYLYQLAQAVPSVQNVEAYAKIVREKFYIRSLITASREIIDSSIDETTSAELLLDAAEQKIYNIRQGRASDAPSRLDDIINNQVLDRLRIISNPEEREKHKGCPTGFSYLDRCISGLNKSDLVIIGARPGMGKTSLALNLARNVAVVGGKKVVMFSLEMTKAQLAERVLATEARVDVKKMRSGEFDDADWQRLGAAVGSLNNCSLYFDDTSSITVPEMKAKIRRMRDVDCVIVDYLGLLCSDKDYGAQRVQEVSDITRNLKLMAKDLNIPVIACSQLARVTEGRGKSHRPMLADLRDSGSIEQDADIVLMLYRPFYYISEKDGPLTEEDLAKKNEAELIIAKNRHGPLDTVNLHWNGEYTLFSTAEKTRYEE